MDILAVLIPLLPFTAAAIIGLGHLFKQIDGRPDEYISAGVSKIAINVSCLLALALVTADFMNMNSGSIVLGQWLGSGNFYINFIFITTGFNVVLAALFSIILVIITRFSTNYIHKESGFHRFFFILSLFSSAILLLILSGNAAGTFIGWEIAGLCSYFLISFAYDRPVASINATRVFVTNRIGDTGFILGIVLSFYFLGTINWNEIAVADNLTMANATIISFCFIVAAFAKSAQLPFSPWLARAMEGPTPSSAVFYGSVMIHAGAFLIILLQPVIELSPFSMGLLVVIGLTTAIYSFVVGLTQTDVKSSLCFAITGQLGLIFLECGLGLWELAMWHLCAHAVVRVYQVMTAPSLLHYVHGNPMKPVSSLIGNKRWLYMASLQRFWLDPITDRTLVRPIKGLGNDLDYFDSTVIERVMGSPIKSERALSSLVQLEEKEYSASRQYEIHNFGRGNGFAGKIFEWTAQIMNWFEERLVLKGIGMDIIDIGKMLGQTANTFEKLILKPRYLVLFVFIVLLIAASY